MDRVAIALDDLVGDRLAVRPEGHIDHARGATTAGRHQEGPGKGDDVPLDRQAVGLRPLFDDDLELFGEFEQLAERGAVLCDMACEGDDDPDSRPVLEADGGELVRVSGPVTLGGLGVAPEPALFAGDRPVLAAGVTRHGAGLDHVDEIRAAGRPCAPLRWSRHRGGRRGRFG
jgi:hypothetical protein